MSSNSSYVPSVTSESADRLHSAWRNFIENGVVPDQGIRPVVAKSWERCRTLKLYEKDGYVLPAKKLNERLENYKNIILIARPVMESICSMTGQSFVILCDNEGYVLEMISNINYTNLTGTSCSEEVIGTNAIGAALIEGGPVVMHGYEHIIPCMQAGSCAAAPFRDQSRDIVGIVNVTNPFGDLPPETMQILNLGVSLIEQQIRSQSEQSRLSEFENMLYSLKEAVQEGLLVVDRDGIIIDLNQKCLNLMDAPDINKYFGRDLHALIRNGNKLISKILSANADCVGDKFELYNGTQHVRCSIVRKESIKNAWGYDKTLILFKADHAREVKTPNTPPLFTFNDIIGESQAWEKIKQVARRAAHVSSNVLIDGESGTGKEMVAQAIHTASGCAGSFIPVNCGAIPKDLIESELFGHEEGSFTGARRGGMVGKIEMADNGTLFLDEIGEMSPEMQVHLLRFLQDRYITRVGGTASKHVNARVIAATNRNLQLLMKSGKFREDLYFRLNVINISIPPLRMRKADILVLTQYFILKFCSRFKRPLLGVDKTTLEALCRYDWPGNIRELSNIIENAVVFADGEIVLPRFLPDHIREYLPSQPIKDKDLRDYEKALISDALKSYQGNISKSARALGMARNTLYRKMKIMGWSNAATSL